MPYVTLTPVTYTVTSSTAPLGSLSIMTTGVILPYTSSRKIAYFQVVGSGAPLYVSYNSGPTSTGNFNVLLAAASTQLGADGGVLIEQQYLGDIAVSGAAGCQFVAWQAV